MSEQKQPELLPCPFCGTDKVGLGASQDMKDGKYIEEGRCWSVLCSGCGASCSLYCETSDEAATAWNMRAGPPAEIATLRAKAAQPDWNYTAEPGKLLGPSTKD